MQENWKPIPDYPGYEVSNHGRVRSFWERIQIGGQHGWKVVLSVNPQKILRGTRAGFKGQYLSVILCKNRTYKRIVIQRLVLLAFVGPPPPQHCALHKDDKPHHNHLNNLYWGTRKDNYADAISNGGRFNPVNYKLSCADVIKIRELEGSGMSCRDIAQIFCVSYSHIRCIVNLRKRKNG